MRHRRNVAAFCLTELGSGSAQAMRATATPSADGGHYLLNGDKIWISNAGYAGVFTMFAKVPVEVDGWTKQRVTAFMVALERNQDARLKVLAERALEAGSLTVDTPTDA